MKALETLQDLIEEAKHRTVWWALCIFAFAYFLSLNVDDAMDDIVRQSRGDSDGLLRVVGSPSLPNEAIVPLIWGRKLSWQVDEMRKQISLHKTSESTNSFSDNVEGEKDGTHEHVEVEESTAAQANWWHSDNELTSEAFPPRVIKHNENFKAPFLRISLVQTQILTGWTLIDTLLRASREPLEGQKTQLGCLLSAAYYMCEATRLQSIGVGTHISFP